MNTKYCTKCERELPVSQFDRDRSNPDGLYANCKDCKRAYRQANRKSWLSTQYERIAGSPEIKPKRKAWNALYYALKVGKITKPETCSICNERVGKDKIQSHHEDYSKPFDVVWCCQNCHVNLDNARREVEYDKARSLCTNP